MCTQTMLKSCIVLSTFVILAGCSNSSQSASTYSATITEGRAAATEVMLDSGASSISIAFVDGNRMIWSEAFGSAEKGTDRNATTATLYGACSVSKMLAAVATMILVDRGQVALDEPVTTYIKNFNMPLDPRYRDITVRMLLNHSSGLPGNDALGNISTDPFTGYAVQVMNGLKYQRLKNTPGTISSYNNDGFTMVENLVKAVTGLEYPDFVRQNILTPLDMNASQYQNVTLPAGSYAASYAGDTLLTMYSLNMYATGGLFSTPEELSHLASMFINKGVYGARQILSEKSVAAMAQDQRPEISNPAAYVENRFGLGWDTVSQPGLAAVGITAWQKGGDMQGYYGTSIIVMPEEKLGVVVFGASNSFDSSSAVKISERIMLRALVERGKLPEMPQLLSTTPLPLKTVTAEEKNAASGYYGSGTTAYRLSFGTDDALSVDEFRTDWTPKYRNMKLRSDNWYAADDDPITAVRPLTWAGRAYFAVRMKRGYGHYSINMMFGQRLDDKLAISAPWQARVNERWLPVNDNPVYFTFGDRSFRFRTINGLTGYLMGNKILRDMPLPSADRLDSMFLVLPDGLRDLQDAGMESWNGQNWLRLGSYLYRPLSGISAAVAGPSTITVGSDRFTEWQELPSSGKLFINGTTGWFLYDADFKQLASGTTSGSPSFSGSGAKYLALFGAQGTNINLNLTTP